MGDLSIQTDVSAFSWMHAESRDVPTTIGLLVPGEHASYMRVLHPAESSQGDAVRWAEVAAEMQHKISRLIQWHELVESPDPDNFRGAKWEGAPPVRGLLIPPVYRALVNNLRKCTNTPDQCFFGVWTGQFSQPVSAPVLAMPPNSGRDFVIFGGPLSDKFEIGLKVGDSLSDCSPNLIWPQDRAWFVVTDMDLDSTLIGGSRELQELILHTPELECWPIYKSDTLAIADS